VADVILWRGLDPYGHDLARLEQGPAGWVLSGTALLAHEGQPCKLDYAVTCDADWRTVSAHVAGFVGGRAVDLRASVDAARTWSLNGAECPAVAGCLDIDLAFTPATNLLPIRRLALAVGAQADVRAAWLRFPSLAFEPLPQVYRRRDERTYGYESGGGSFRTTLEVNAAGFVTRYPDLWEAECVWSGA
jgi:hypothetical protein